MRTYVSLCHFCVHILIIGKREPNFDSNKCTPQVTEFDALNWRCIDRYKWESINLLNVERNVHLSEYKRGGKNAKRHIYEKYMMCEFRAHATKQLTWW